MLYLLQYALNVAEYVSMLTPSSDNWSFVKRNKNQTNSYLAGNAIPSLLRIPLIMTLYYILHDCYYMYG